MWEKLDTTVMRLRAGDRHVEPALTALLVERSEVVAHPPVGGLRVAGGEENRVPLVTLDALDVLHEGAFVVALVEEPVECGVACLAEPVTQ